jgi:hypothetical protein
VVMPPHHHHHLLLLLLNLLQCKQEEHQIKLNCLPKSMLVKISRKDWKKSIKKL